MIFRVRVLIVCISALFYSCNESASSKIKTDVNSNLNSEILYSEITFDKVIHDFGNITEGEVVKTSFKFTNTGDSDLYIVNAVASCGCTIPNYPKNVPIEPGNEGEIEVNFDSKGRPNFQSKLVKISTNTESGSIFLKIQAFVEPKK
tara:strand:+ start:432 stop:872 length:441 start_codon:yes stop_codon:yes gene_type:complete